MKTINVVAAIIHRGEEILSTQRGYGEYEGWWEFPGGKIEPGEGSEVALRREIMEELGVEIVVENLLCTVEYDYPKFHLSVCHTATISDTVTHACHADFLLCLCADGAHQEQ